jgi:hypothetical protein
MDSRKMSLQPQSPETASEIYRQLIVRIRKKVKEKESVVFDPDTGIQKCFLNGKLLWTKKVRS